MFRMSDKELAEQLLAMASQLTKLASNLSESDRKEAEFPAERWPQVEARTCLICETPILRTETPARGAHNRCYKRLIERIKLGELTDSQAVAMGKLTPAQKGGRKPSITSETVDQIIREAAGQYEGTAKAAKKPPTKPKPGKP